MPDELEVVTAEPSAASLLDERQPPLPTPFVHGYGADAEQFRGLHAGQPVMLGVGWLGPAFALPRRILRLSGSLLTFGSELQHLLPVQRCSPRAAAGGQLALRDELSDQRNVAPEDLGRLGLSDPHG